MLTGVIYESLNLTVPGMESISTRAELKEQSILDHLAISDLQIITASGRSGPKLEGLSCLTRLILSALWTMWAQGPRPPPLYDPPWLLEWTIGSSTNLCLCE